MEIFGITIAPTSKIKEMATIHASGGWHPYIHEPYAGAWQKNDEEKFDSVMQYGPVFACQTLIAGDISKMRCRIVEFTQYQTWEEVGNNTAHTPVLRKPNHFQNRIQFFENWMLSKLSHGNTIAIKARDNRNVVQALYILDWNRVKVLVSDAGEVFYELRQDKLSRLYGDTLTVPASEIIHDRFNCLFHPLIGLSPLFAASLAASQGLRIQRTASKFWKLGARPSGVLTAPNEINDENAKRLKEYWEANFSGDNVAKVAVLGDGLKYEQMSMSSVDAQLVEQLGYTGKEVASVYHVPAYKIGADEPPSYDNINALDQAYYSQCLQIHIEQIELCLDEGLELAKNQAGNQLGTEFDLSDLMRMDQATQVKTEGEAVNRGIKAPNESRKLLNLRPKPGGDTPFMQQQMWPLDLLAEREPPTDGPVDTGTTPPEDGVDGEDGSQADGGSGQDDNSAAPRRFYSGVARGFEEALGL